MRACAGAWRRWATTTPDGTIDETGTRLVLADAKERAGDLPMAVTLRQRVLDDRLALAREKARRRP